MPIRQKSRVLQYVTWGVLALAIWTPVTASAMDDAFAPDCATASWETTRGGAVVEPSRAVHPISLLPEPDWDQTSGYGVVEANRVAAASLFTAR